VAVEAANANLSLYSLQRGSLQGSRSFSDYAQVVVGNNFHSFRPTYQGRRITIYHEFGHSIRHVADGDRAHWDGDVGAYAYGRVHDDNMLLDAGFAFNEGWAHYWGCMPRTDFYCPPIPATGTQYEWVCVSADPSLYQDWNEITGGQPVVPSGK